MQFCILIFCNYKEGKIGLGSKRLGKGKSILSSYLIVSKTSSFSFTMRQIFVLNLCGDKSALWSHWYSLFWTLVDSAHRF